MSTSAAVRVYCTAVPPFRKAKARHARNRLLLHVLLHGPPTSERMARSLDRIAAPGVVPLGGASLENEEYTLPGPKREW